MSLLPDSEKQNFLHSLSPQEANLLLYEWEFWARPDQLPPQESWWNTWLILAGRGWGKTRTGAEWIRSIAEGPTPLSKPLARRIAFVGETASDVRDVMVEGDSGILAISPRDYRPLYEPSKRRLSWPNGTTAYLYNATEPENLRGPQFDHAWLDELAKWRYVNETWDMLQFGLRLGSRPRQIITTTPKPITLLKEIIRKPTTLITRGSTYDNRLNLAASFFSEIITRYEGTRLGRQELDAELLEDAAGALWSRELLDKQRVRDVPGLFRTVVGVDPSGARSVNDDNLAETGIVVAARGVDDRGYALADYSLRGSPHEWGSQAVKAYHDFSADAIVVETNFGGAMVASVIRNIEPYVKIIEVTASRGKHVRAEPIAALMEQGRIHHWGALPELEDQLALFTSEGYQGDLSPDRADAYVWAFTELMVRPARRVSTQRI